MSALTNTPSSVSMGKTLSDRIFDATFKKAGDVVKTSLNFLDIVNLETQPGEIKALTDVMNRRRYILMSTELGNVLISRVKNQRRRDNSEWCYRILYQNNNIGSFTRIKQNSSMLEEEIIKVLGYNCDNLHQRFVNRRTDGTNRFAW